MVCSGIWKEIFSLLLSFRTSKTCKTTVAFTTCLTCLQSQSPPHSCLSRRIIIVCTKPRSRHVRIWHRARHTMPKRTPPPASLRISRHKNLWLCSEYLIPIFIVVLVFTVIVAVMMLSNNHNPHHGGRHSVPPSLAVNHTEADWINCSLKIHSSSSCDLRLYLRWLFYFNNLIVLLS